MYQRVKRRKEAAPELMSPRTSNATPHILGRPIFPQKVTHIILIRFHEYPDMLLPRRGSQATTRTLRESMGKSQGCNLSSLLHNTLQYRTKTSCWTISEKLCTRHVLNAQCLRQSRCMPISPCMLISKGSGNALPIVDFWTKKQTV